MYCINLIVTSKIESDCLVPLKGEAYGLNVIVSSYIQLFLEYHDLSRQVILLLWIKKLQM